MNASATPVGLYRKRSICDEAIEETTNSVRSVDEQGIPGSYFAKQDLRDKSSRAADQETLSSNARDTHGHGKVEGEGTNFQSPDGKKRKTPEVSEAPGSNGTSVGHSSQAFWGRDGISDSGHLYPNTSENESKGKKSARRVLASKIPFGATNPMQESPTASATKAKALTPATVSRSANTGKSSRAKDTMLEEYVVDDDNGHEGRDEALDGEDDTNFVDSNGQGKVCVVEKAFQDIKNVVDKKLKALQALLARQQREGNKTKTEKSSWEWQAGR